MRLIGLFLLLAGWVIALAAVALIRLAAERAGFALAGAAVEALGLGLLVHAHLLPRGEQR